MVPKKNWNLFPLPPLTPTNNKQEVPPSSAATAAAKSLQSCPTLCDPIDGSPPGSPSLGFSRQEHWSGLPFLLQCMKVKSESEFAQSCLTLCSPMDCSLPGSSAHGILKARVLEWGAIAFSNHHLQQISIPIIVIKSQYEMMLTLYQVLV